MSDTNEIQLTADFSDFINATLKTVGLTNQQAESFRRLIKVTEQYDDAGLKLTTTVSGQIAEHQKLNLVLKQEEGQLKAVKTTIVQLNQATVESARIAREAEKQRRDATRAALEQAQAEAAGILVAQAAARRASQERARDAERREREAARDAELAAKAQARELRTGRIGILDTTVRQQTAAERAKLQPSGLDISAGGQGKLTVLARSIAEVGVQAGLTVQGLKKLFAQVAAGDFSSIDSKYAKVVDKILAYNKVLEGEAGKLAKGAGKGPEIPAPNTGHIERLKEYGNILNRIQGTLTNLAIYRGFNILTNQLTDSIKSARDYETQVALIRTISQDANLSTNQWSQGLKQVSNSLAIDFKDVAAAAYDAVSSQITQGDNTFKYLGDVGKLARATGSDLKTAQAAIADVLNSYNLGSEKTGEVAAKLFRTIDLGNVKLDELGGTIGRVTSLGNELGITFDETLALISTFTRNGIKTADAMTYLNNVMTKLLQPTEQAKTLFQEIGIASGPAGVKVQGFMNILGKLADAQGAGKVEALDLFPEIRGAKGFALFKQNIKEAERDLDEIKNKSGQYFNNATDIVSQTAADKINRATTTFKNALATSAGDAVNRILADFIGLQQGAENIEDVVKKAEAAASRFFRIVGTGAVSIGTFVVAMRTLAVVTELNALASAKAATAKTAEMAAQLRANGATMQAIQLEATLNAVKRGGAGSLTAFAGANPLLAGLAVGATALAGYAAYKSLAVDAFNGTAEAYEDLARRIRGPEANKKIEETISLVDKLKTEFQDASKVFGSALVEALAKNNAALLDVRDKMKGSQESLKAGFANVLDGASKDLDRIKTKISDIKNTLKDQAKKQFEFKDSVQQGLYGTLQKFANPQQQLQLISGEYNRIKDQIRKLISDGTPDAINEAEKLFGKLESLSTNYYEKQGDMQKEQFEKSITDQVARGQLQPGNYNFAYDNSEQLKAANNLLAFRNELEEKGRQILLAKQRDAEKEEMVAKRKQEAQKKAIADFESFGLTTDTGQFKQKYRNTQDQLDPKKVQDDFKKTVANLKQYVGEDVLKNLDFGKAVAERERLINEEVIRTIAGKGLGDSQKQLTDGLSQFSRQLENGDKKISAYAAAVQGLSADLKTLLGQLNDTGKALPSTLNQANLNGKELFGIKPGGTKLGRYVQEFGSEFGEQVNRQFGKTAQQEIEDMFNVLASQGASLDARLKDLPNRTTEIGGRKVVDPKEVRRLLEDVRKFQGDFKYATESSLNKYGQTGGDSTYLNGTKETLGEMTKLLDNFDKRFKEAGTGLILGGQELNEAQGKIKTLQETMDAAKNSYNEMQKGIQGVVGQTTMSTEAQIRQLEALARKAAEVTAALNALNGAGGAAPAPAAPQTKFYGGPIYRAYGGPVGQDNVPAWLAEREIVVNRAASDKFYSQIMSMNNSARTPQYFNAGGQVGGGNHTFNITESKNPQVTAREVQRLLDRNKRLGN